MLLVTRSRARNKIGRFARNGALTKKKFTLSDLIVDKLELLGDIYEQCNDCMQDDLIVYDAEPAHIWNDGFETWEEFRLTRKKRFIDSKVVPNSKFPLAELDKPEPGWIIIIKDDCIDLITILEQDNFQTMPTDFVRSIYSATDIISIRHGGMLQYYNTYYERIYNSRSTKSDNHAEKKDKVLESFNNLFQNTNLQFITENKVATEIMKSQKLNTGTYPISRSTIKSILRELHEDKSISLPWVTNPSKM
jgi:hypothetical protein